MSYIQDESTALPAPEHPSVELFGVLQVALGFLLGYLIARVIWWALTRDRA